MTINGGLVGPKAMAKAAADGQLVNIPAPPYFFNGVTEKIDKGLLLDLGNFIVCVLMANPEN